MPDKAEVRILMERQAAQNRGGNSKTTNQQTPVPKTKTRANRSREASPKILRPCIPVTNRGVARPMRTPQVGDHNLTTAVPRKQEKEKRKPVYGKLFPFSYIGS